MTRKVPLCQSCGMPMDEARLFGTRSDGSTCEEYCIHCYQNGKFTEPDITMDQMIEQCVAFITEQKSMPREEAHHYMAATLPTLQRWTKF